MSQKMLKIAIQQPALPQYRLSVFKKLSEVFSITVFYGSIGNLENLDTKDFKSLNSNIIRLFKDTKFELLWDNSQIRLTRTKKWDVVILSWGNRYVSLLPALLLAKISGTSVILWGHGYSKNSGRLMTLYRNFLARFADTILLYDTNTLNQIKSDIQLKNKNVFAAPNAIDQAPIESAKYFWKNNSKQLNEFLTKYNLQDRFQILFVSRIERANNIEILIKATAILKSKIPNVLSVIIGSSDNEYKAELDQLIDELDCRQNIFILGPIYEETELAPWFLTSNIFCYPTNIGLSLMHSLGYDLPVIIGDDLSKCNPEVYCFQPGRNGLTFKDGDPSALAATLWDYSRDDKQQLALSKNCAKTIKSIASLDQMVDGMSKAIISANKKDKK